MKSSKQKTICLARCHHDVVKRIAKEAGFKRVPEKNAWNVIWTDTPLPVHKLLEMRRLQDARSVFRTTAPSLQRANHFPGMKEICRKDSLALNLNRMKDSFPYDYDFFPNTWSLPSGFSSLKEYKRRNLDSMFICKPGVGSQGRGIFLMRSLRNLDPLAKLICQVYIPRPLLIDGFKFDFRIYVLITSCDPLRIYIYDEGIARFATIKYEPPSDSNIDEIFMHLTNYSLNKHSKSYSPEQDGSKRTMSSVFRRMEMEGWDTRKVKADIDEVIVKTLIAAQPALRQYYRCSFPKLHRACSCFEILGFDILVDEDLRPYLLEVNHSPSFNLDLPVDKEVKEALLTDTFNKLYVGRSSSGAKQEPDNPWDDLTLRDSAGQRISHALDAQFLFESQQKGNYRLLYPRKDAEKYIEFLEEAPGPTYMDPAAQIDQVKVGSQVQPHKYSKKATTRKNQWKSDAMEDHNDQEEIEDDLAKFFVKKPKAKNYSLPFRKTPITFANVTNPLPTEPDEFVNFIDFRKSKRMNSRRGSTWQPVKEDETFYYPSKGQNGYFCY